MARSVKCLPSTQEDTEVNQQSAPHKSQAWQSTSVTPELRRQKAGRSLSSRPVLVNKTKFHARVESKSKQTNLFVNLQMASGVTYHLPLYFWLKRKDF